PELHPCLRDENHTEGSKMDQAMIGWQPTRKRNTILKKSIEKLRSSLDCCHLSKQCCCSNLRSLFPFTKILNGYSGLYDLPCDIIAGLTVGIMHIPQGMAYALLAQLPPVYGLYTSFFPVLVYFLFGTSKHISVVINDIRTGHNITHSIGDEGMLTTTAPHNENLTSLTQMLRNQHMSQLDSIKVGYAMAVTFAVGVLQVFLGAMRLGFLTTFLSDPLISGFTTGAAVHVFSSQVKSAFGVTVQQYSGPFKLIFSYRDFFTNIKNTNIVTMSATLVAVLVLIAIREGINSNKTYKARMKGIPVPGELMVIIVGTILSRHFALHKEFGVAVIGHIPKGFPAVSFTFVKYLPDVIGESFAICFTAFATSFAISKILADKHNYIVDPNQELIAHGASNVLGCMFSSFCSAASLSRSVVQNDVGGKTQFVSLISSALVVVVLLALGPLFQDLPNSILAAIIIVSLKGLLMQFTELKRLWTVSKVDYTVWLVTFVATVFLDVDLGLLIGLIYNIVPILLRTQQPYCCLLGRLPNTDVFVDSKVHLEAVPVPGIKIFKFEAPLYFANMDNFKAALIRETGINPHSLKQLKAQMKDSDMTLRHREVCMATSDTWPNEPCESHEQERPLGSRPFPANCESFAIIIDGSSIQYVDSVTVRVLKEIVLEYAEVDIDVYLGECKAPVRVMLDKSGFYRQVPRRNVCATIGHAVRVAQKSALLSRETLSSTYTMEPEDFIKDGEFVKLDLETSAESIDRIATGPNI
ncbi:unnamed protein product, partial [Candidula unifasciata]